MTVVFCGHVITGASSSVTVTVNWQLAGLLDVSEAEHVTVDTPFGNVEPLEGVQVTVLLPSQLSEAVMEGKLTTAEQALDAVPDGMLTGHPLRTGATLSVTVTVNVQLAGLFEVSEALQVTVVTPLLNVAPLAGSHVTVRLPSQLSDAVG